MILYLLAFQELNFCMNVVEIIHDVNVIIISFHERLTFYTAMI